MLLLAYGTDLVGVPTRVGGDKGSPTCSRDIFDFNYRILALTLYAYNSMQYCSPRPTNRLPVDRHLGNGVGDRTICEVISYYAKSSCLLIAS
jgi:hypothetical protein